MISDFIDSLINMDIPTCLRICAGTDGSVTYLLELMTKKKVKVIAHEQNLIHADKEIANALGIEEGDEVNRRVVALEAGNVIYVSAISLAPIKYMPQDVRNDLLQADIPIGKILRKHKLETRRDIGEITIVESDIFKGVKTLRREYRILHENRTLMWICEMFPIDDRWDL